MTVRLNRSYFGYPIGTITVFPQDVEQSLIATGAANLVASGSPLTSGNQTTTLLMGQAAIPAGARSITITNSSCDAQSLIMTTITQVTPDTTLTSVYGAATVNGGGFVITGNANATAAVNVGWMIVNNPFYSS